MLGCYPTLTTGIYFINEEVLITNEDLMYQPFCTPLPLKVCLWQMLPLFDHAQKWLSMLFYHVYLHYCSTQKVQFGLNLKGKNSALDWYRYIKKIKSQIYSQKCEL